MGVPSKAQKEMSVFPETINECALGAATQD